MQCIRSHGSIALEARHHHAPKTCRRRAYTSVGTITVTTEDTSPPPSSNQLVRSVTRCSEGQSMDQRAEGDLAHANCLSVSGIAASRRPSRRAAGLRICEISQRPRTLAATSQDLAETEG